MSRKIVNGKPVPYKRNGIITEHIYELELYPVSENAQFDFILKKVQTLFPLADIVWIFHNRDKFEDGTKKKNHYHLLINFPRERSIRKLALDLDIPENLIQWKCYLDLSVQYLIHLNDPDKAQYDISELDGSSNWYMRFLGGDFASNTQTELNIIVDFIEKNRDHITYAQILRFCSEHNLLRIYKSWYSIIRDIYQDHRNDTGF